MQHVHCAGQVCHFFESWTDKQFNVAFLNSMNSIYFHFNFITDSLSNINQCNSPFSHATSVAIRIERNRWLESSTTLKTPKPTTHGDFCANPSVHLKEWIPWRRPVKPDGQDSTCPSQRFCYISFRYCLRWHSIHTVWNRRGFECKRLSVTATGWFFNVPLEEVLNNSMFHSL